MSFHRSCTGKVRHETKAAATDHAKALLRQFGRRKFAYHCKRCGGFHVGHQHKSRAVA